MPLLKDATSLRWQTVIKGALQRRVDFEQLKQPLKDLYRTHAISGTAIAYLLIGFRAAANSVDDPLLFQYARGLLTEQYLSASDLLLALLASTPMLDSNADTGKIQNLSGLPSCEERIFLLISDTILLYESTIASAQIRKTTSAVIRWLQSLSNFEYNKQIETAGLHTLSQVSFNTYEALAGLAIAIFGKPSFRNVSKQVWWKGRRETVVREMLRFDTSVLQWMQSSISGRLQALTKTPPFIETSTTGHPVLGPQLLMESLAQDLVLGPAHSRAGLYVWLNACLCERPMTDDLATLTYLQTRYAGDPGSLTVQLSHASFDVLTNAVLRGDRAHDILVIRSFICNKLPGSLAMLASFTGQGTIESSLQSSFVSIAMDPIPPISAGSTQATEILRRTRLEFLQACILHGVIGEVTAVAINQGASVPRLKAVRHTKDGLINQCANNIGRFEVLIHELTGMQGNAAPLSNCIVELLGSMCNSKDTMSLKTVCNILIKRVPDMDIVFQYVQPATMLVPMCTLLKEWVHDQDQSEFTPAYEEYASVLLLTQAVMHRYGITITEIGFSEDDGSISQLLSRSFSGTPSNDLSDEQSQQLGKWLEGFFATDDQGETGGIGDEVMRRCPPQAYYVLVPALLEQSVNACRSGYLNMSTFKSGLELLLEPFLLPSLVVGLSWVAEHSWEDHVDTDIILQMLDKLLKPSSSASETRAMHKVVLDIVAEPLERFLKDLVRKRPGKTGANGLITVLQRHANTRRQAVSSKYELEQWTADQGVVMHLRSTIRDLISWAASATPLPPPLYTHKLLHTAWRVMGADQTVRSIAAELQATLYPNAAIALDVGMSMLSAPNTASDALRQHLLTIVGDPETLLELPASQATSLIQLSRSVEAQLTVQQIEMPVSVPAQQATDEMMQQLGLASVSVDLGNAQSAEGGEHGAVQMTEADLDAAIRQSADKSFAETQNLSELGSESMQIDQSQNFFTDLAMDLDQQQASTQIADLGSNLGTLSQTNQEDDIFADLDMGAGIGDLGDFNFT